MCYIKIESGFIRPVALGIGLLLTLIPMSAAGYALDNLGRETSPYYYHNAQWQPFSRTFYPPCFYVDANNIDFYSIAPVVYYNTPMVYQPIPAGISIYSPGLAYSNPFTAHENDLATNDFKAPDYRVWCESAREEYRKLKEAVAQENTNRLIEKAAHPDY